jgi:hypothetical protein
LRHAGLEPEHHLEFVGDLDTAVPTAAPDSGPLPAVRIFAEVLELDERVVDGPTLGSCMALAWRTPRNA